MNSLSLLYQEIQLMAIGKVGTIKGGTICYILTSLIDKCDKLE